MCKILQEDVYKIFIFAFMKMGEKIKELREKMGLTQEEFAKKLGITRQSVIKIEKSTKDVSIEILAKISNILGTTADYLISTEIKRPLDFMETNTILREYNYIDTEKLDRLLQSTGQYEIESVTTVQHRGSEGRGMLAGGADLMILEKGVKAELSGEANKSAENSVTSKLSKTIINKATDLVAWINKNPNVLTTSLENREKVHKGLILQLDMELLQNNFESSLDGMQELLTLVSNFSPNAIKEEDQKMMKSMVNFLTDQRYYHLLSENEKGIRLIGLFRKDRFIGDLEAILGESTVLFKIQRIIADQEKFYLIPDILRKAMKDEQLENLVKSFSSLNQFGLEFGMDDLEISGPLIVYEPILSFK